MPGLDLLDPNLDYGEVPINFEMTVGCGLCGPEWWLTEAPRFRLYADGLVLFRSSGTDQTSAPYRVARLHEDGMTELFAYVLDEGGLRGAKPYYRGDADDAGVTRFALHAQWADDEAEADVAVEPLLGDGTTDADGRLIEDRERYEQFRALADQLSTFDGWLSDRGITSQPFTPDAYVAAMAERFDGTGEAPWPLADLGPDAFADGAWGFAFARLTPDQAAAAGLGPGGGSIGMHQVSDNRVATILARPLLPGDDRPGAFGLRRDTVAVTTEPRLRVRSLPEVSDASVKHEPLLDRNDALYIIDGPIAGTGYQWYEVYAPRTGLSGFVAAASKERQDWIVPAPLPCTLGASPFEIVDKIGYDLMHLACYSGVEMGGTYVLKRFSDDGLHCPDTFQYVTEPDWLDLPLACQFEFGPEEADTGGYDLPAGGVLHPSVADVPARLLKASPEGLMIEVSGAIDHPDSRSCVPLGDVVPDFRMIQLKCRGTFVITELRPAD